MISQDQMAAAMPRAQAQGRVALWYPHLVANMAKYDIVTVPRQAMFLANLCAESGELAEQIENLHYSGERLRQVYPSLFGRNPALADQLAAQGPEAIANYIYADANRPPNYRMGNVAPGDGWKYRGRSGMQLTGRQNYERFFASIGLPITTDPDEILKPAIGAMSAAHFWKSKGCNDAADNGNFEEAVRLVNGGTNGMAARQLYLSRFQAALGGA